MDPVGAAVADRDPRGLTPGQFVDYAVAVLGVEAGMSREEVERMPLDDLKNVLIYAGNRP